MRKLQQFSIFKLPTNLLKRKNYNLNLSIEESRRSGLIVSLGDSQLLRSLRRLKGIEFSQDTLNSLIEEKQKIKHKKSSSDNIRRLLELEQQIDRILFVPEIVSIQVDNVKHYSELGINGFILNNIHFVRFACGAGQSRRNNALFIADRYEKELKRILNNNRNESVELNPSKFSAYFSLASSSSLSVSFPYFAVIPDKEIIRTERVDFIEEQPVGDDTVTEMDREIPFNLFDGQGLISPRLAKQWAEELDISYIPSAFIIRGNFIKGMVCTIDFQRYSELVENHYLIDVWGNKINTRDLDLILSASQFKLWQSYSSCSEYIQNCKDNDLGFSITRVSPQKEKSHVFLNYQFIQATRMNDESLKRLCQPTIDYFRDIVKIDINKTLLYLLGKKTEKYDCDIFDKLNDNVTKALILNNDLLKDPYIKNHLISSLNKKIRDSYMGNILVNGQYSFMISDPYAQMQFIFGNPITGLLERGEHYNRYFLDKGRNKLAGMRAPLTFCSEVNILNLKDNEVLQDWYFYLKQCVIYNVFGNDTLLHADSDFDGDGVCITDNQEMIDGAVGGYPINYQNQKAGKVKIVEDDLYKSDIKGFNSQVGFVTNVATSAFAMLSLFDEDSLEYKELFLRIKRMRKEQGSQIDFAKGLIIKPFPKHWTRWNRINNDMPEETKKELSFKNSIAIEHRPLFMRYVYSSYNRQFLKYQKNKEISCYLNLGIHLKDLLEKENPNEEELQFIKNYNHYNPFITSNCLMNRLCLYMESNLKELKRDSNDLENSIKILKNKDVGTDPEVLKSLYDLYKKYRSEKRNFLIIKDDEETKYKTIEQFNKKIRQEAFQISSNASLLCNCAVDIVYVVHKLDNKQFLWNIFGQDLLENIKLNKQEKQFIPVEDENGDILFLGTRYSMKEIDIEQEEDDFSINDYL